MKCVPCSSAVNLIFDSDFNANLNRTQVLHTAGKRCVKIHKQHLFTADSVHEREAQTRTFPDEAELF